jgi:hypothetical protein
VAAVRETSIVMATALGAIFLGERVTRTRMAGAAVVVAGHAGAGVLAVASSRGRRLPMPFSLVAEVAYLQAVYGVRADESCCLFDDDNDLPMAERCAVHYLPGLTSQSVSRAAAEHPEWHVASKAGQGVFAIEECLEQLLERVVREQEGGTVDVGGGGGSGVAAPTASKGTAAAAISS